jgi:hypothetical protein
MPRVRGIGSTPKRPRCSSTRRLTSVGLGLAPWRKHSRRLQDLVRSRADYFAYGYRRTWKVLRRAGEQVPRRQVQWLMKANGIVGASDVEIHGGRQSRSAGRSPAHLVQRAFSASRRTSSGRRHLLPALLGGGPLLRVRARRLQPDDRRLAGRLPTRIDPRIDAAVPSRRLCRLRWQQARCSALTGHPRNDKPGRALGRHTGGSDVPRPGAGMVTTRPGPDGIGWLVLSEVVATPEPLSDIQRPLFRPQPSATSRP